MKITKMERLREVLQELGLKEAAANCALSKVTWLLEPLTPLELVQICEAYKDSVVTEMMEIK